MRAARLVVAVGMALLLLAAVALVSGSGPVRRWRAGDGFEPDSAEPK